MYFVITSQVNGIVAIHEFHVWQLAGNRIIASAHITCQNLQDYMRVAEDVKTFFHNERIHSTTIQPEFLEVCALLQSYDVIFLFSLFTSPALFLVLARL